MYQESGGSRKNRTGRGGSIGLKKKSVEPCRKVLTETDQDGRAFSDAACGFAKTLHPAKSRRRKRQSTQFGPPANDQGQMTNDYFLKNVFPFALYLLNRLFTYNPSR